jgi:hypothetical protein
MGTYNIPSKMVETHGRTFGLKPEIKETSNVFVPGPGAYTQEKAKERNLSWSMGKKLEI